mmetsp:Transcript_17738/g.41271  ORF Transcript_17738/g.41271 Transcript_17738/m.41271 type:complete len:264 (+) Transcript_17738:1747-2538(+)
MRGLQQALQRRTLAWHHIGSKYRQASARRRSVVHHVDEVSQVGIAIIKLMVAQGEGIKANVLHHRSISSAPKQAVERGASDGITGMQLQHSMAGNPRVHLQLMDCTHQTGESADLQADCLGGGVDAERLAAQVRVMIVDVKDVEPEVCACTEDGARCISEGLSGELRQGRGDQMPKFLRIPHQALGVLDECVHNRCCIVEGLIAIPSGSDEAVGEDRVCGHQIYGLPYTHQPRVHFQVADTISHGGAGIHMEAESGRVWICSS